MFNLLITLFKYMFRLVWNVPLIVYFCLFFLILFIVLEVWNWWNTKLTAEDVKKYINARWDALQYQQKEVESRLYVEPSMENEMSQNKIDVLIGKIRKLSAEQILWIFPIAFVLALTYNALPTATTWTITVAMGFITAIRFLGPLMLSWVSSLIFEKSDSPAPSRQQSEILQQIREVILGLPSLSSSEEETVAIIANDPRYREYHSNKYMFVYALMVMLSIALAITFHALVTKTSFVTYANRITNPLFGVLIFSLFPLLVLPRSSLTFIPTGVVVFMVLTHIIAKRKHSALFLS